MYCTSKKFSQVSLRDFLLKLQVLRKNVAAVFRKKSGSLPPTVEKNVADGVNEEEDSLEHVVNRLKINISNFVMPL
jgi:hypothetical protein